MATLNDMRLALRLAHLGDRDEVVELSQRVQDALTASSSLQHIGPLNSEDVSKAIIKRKCFVLEQRQADYITTKLIGCALSRELEAGYFLTTSGFNIESFPSPWLYLHSIMLDPELQGNGIGIPFVSEIVKTIACLSPTEGTLFLDCWAGNEKLRRFYSNVGFNFAAVIPEEDYEIAVFFRPLHATNPVGASH